MIALARTLILALLPAMLTATALAAQAPWWLTLGLGIPTLMLNPGLGWARWLAARQAARPASTDAPCRAPTALQIGLDAAWISMAWTWLAVALVRETGLRGDAEAYGLLALAAAFGLLGQWLDRDHHPASPPIPGERLGSAAVVVAVLLSALWRYGDLVRPLDGYWWMAGADDEGHQVLPIVAGQGFAAVTPLGWPESGALRLDLPPGDAPVQATLVASEAAKGRLILAVRGPIGSQVQVGDREATVARSIQEEGEDKPVRRYLDKGTAGLALDVDLKAGQAVAVQVRGDSLYVLPGTEAVWAAHASGDLRYTHYWQILNQVENLDWAAEVLDWRWFTLHQPPAWSPLLATSLLLGDGDLPGNNLLFLWVIGLVGLSAVRLSALLAPRAPAAAWLIPAGGRRSRPADVRARQHELPRQPVCRRRGRRGRCPGVQTRWLVCRPGAGSRTAALAGHRRRHHPRLVLVGGQQGSSVAEARPAVGRRGGTGCGGFGDRADGRAG
ncbi:MAG: hypothetical protein GXP62_16175 [Oligoflexia bacterium]|nr:hypothetical protein [Oligoflexia bacterium]